MGVLAFNIYDVERAFIDALCAAGIPPADGDSGFRLDGEKHRYKVSGDKARERSGEYCVYMDDCPAGYFKSYRASHGVPFSTWCFKSETFSTMSTEERAAYVEQRAAEKAERDKQAALCSAKAIDSARRKWAASTPANPLHSYCVKKKLSSVHGARLLGNNLIIPYRNTEGDIVTVQTISGDGSKLFETNAPKFGSFCVLSVEAEHSEGIEKVSWPEEKKAPTRAWVCEGWATGCSVQEAVGECVIAAADCGNLHPVIKNLRELWPSCELVIAADNDAYKNAGNPGAAAAIKVFEDFGVPFVYPDFESSDRLSDWNDYAAKYGLKKCRHLLLRKLEAFKKSLDYTVKHSTPQFVHVTESSGRPKGTIPNLEALLSFAGITVKYDEIKKEGIVSVPGRDYCGDDVKNATLGHILSLCAQWGFPKGDVDPFLAEIAARNVINPVRDWILSEPWDGMNRIQNIYDSVESESYFPIKFKEVLIRKWLVSAVAAAFHPRGFHYRGVLTFIGGQGIGKTTWFRLLAGKDDFFVEGIGMDPNDKDSLKRGISFWISEFGELEGTFKKSDKSALKNFLTRSTDTVRMPWGRRMSEFQRRTVFGATVNQREILMDDTGNSRWWCIPVARMHMIDRADMQQMWREVYEEYYLRGKDDPLGQWWLTKDEEEELGRQNWHFEAPNPIEDMILRGLEWDTMPSVWCNSTATQVLIDCGYVGVPRPGDAVKAAIVLRKLTGSTSVQSGHNNARLWKVPPKRTIFN